MHLSISSSKFISLGTPRVPAVGKLLVILQTGYLLETPNFIFLHEQQQAHSIANEECHYCSLCKIIPQPHQIPGSFGRKTISPK